MSIGSIFANIGRLFKTTAELEQESRIRRRNAERGVERALEVMAESYARLERDQNDFYQKGKAKLSVGRDSEARQFFQFSRMQSVAMANLIRQKLVWEGALTQIRIGSSLQSAAQCFGALAAEYGLEVASFENGLDSIDGVTDVVGEMNRAMERKWKRDSAKAGAADTEDVDAGIDEMMKIARGELAAEANIDGMADPGPGSATR